MNSQFLTTRIAGATQCITLKTLKTSLKIRGFSRKTIKAYLHYNIKFLNFAKKSQKEIINEDIKNIWNI